MTNDVMLKKKEKKKTRIGKTAFHHISKHREESSKIRGTAEYF